MNYIGYLQIGTVVKILVLTFLFVAVNVEEIVDEKYFYHLLLIILIKKGEIHERNNKQLA